MRINKCPDLPLEPEEREEESYYCPVCGEELEDSDWIYERNGEYTGCEHCQRRYHAYAAGLRGRRAG